MKTTLPILIILLLTFWSSAQDIFFIKCVDADNRASIDFFTVSSTSKKIEISELENGVIKLSNFKQGEDIQLSSPDYNDNEFHRKSKRENLGAKYNGDKIYESGDTIVIELVLKHHLLIERWNEEDKLYGEADTMNIETEVDTPPSAIDETEFTKFISERLHFPRHVVEQNVQGRVYLSVIIETDGTFSNIKIVRSVDEYLDRIALRALRSPDLPKFNPAIKNGVPVRSKVTYPINFNLY